MLRVAFVLRSTDVLPAFPDLSYFLIWRQTSVRAVVCWKARRDEVAFLEKPNDHSIRALPLLF